MNPEDPRHGTNGGYLAHIFDRETTCQPCRDAHALARRNNWRKRYARNVDALYIDSTGTIRRIRALMAIGWRYRDIDTAAGHTTVRASWSHNIVTHGKVHLDTAAKIDKVYRQMCMSPGPSTRVRNIATRNGWPPPLSWDDIDRDPAPTNTRNVRELVDPQVVERLAAGHRVDFSTRAEKLEAMRRWLEEDRSEAELCRIHGWRPGRYKTTTDVAA